jgi:endonuclease YncB( thermonuclease family)
MNLIEELRNNLNNSKLYIFQNLEISALCYKVIDGDTIKCVIKWKDEYLKIVVRLDNVDTAEKRSKIDSERKLAEKATLFTKKLLEDKAVYLVFKESDKYGRHLCKVYLNKEESAKLGASVSEQLIKNNIALSYDGGKKRDFSSIENINDII